MSRRKTPLDRDHIEAHMCDLTLRLYILARLPFFLHLDSKAVAEINELFVERGYQPGESIYLEGDQANRLYVVADGQVSLMGQTTSGKEVMLDILKQGEFFGSLTHSPKESYSETARAHTPVCSLSIEGGLFRELLNKYPSVAIKVMDLVNARLKAAQEMVRLLSTAAVEQRLAHVLLTLADKFGELSSDGLLIQVPLGRADLAELAGTTPETASRLMSQFQKDGLIQTGRRWVSILDKSGLSFLIEP